MNSVSHRNISSILIYLGQYAGEWFLMQNLLNHDKIKYQNEVAQVIFFIFYFGYG